MRRLHLASVCALLVVSPTPGSGAHAIDEPVPSVRPLQTVGQQLLARGTEGSPTFRDLLMRLEGSDLIVYVDVRPDVPADLGGVMRFVVATTTHRIVRVTISGRHSRGTMVALLGHELRHCVEVAEAPHVRSERAMRAYYEDTGIRLARNRYDSHAAQDAGRAIRYELATGRPDLRLARAAQDTEDRLLSGGSIGGELMP